MKRTHSGEGSVRSHKRQRSVQLHSTLNKHYKPLNSANDYSKLFLSEKPLDIFVWGTGSMCELGLGPSHKNKEVKRPRLNPFLMAKEGTEPFITSICCGGMHTIALSKDNKVYTWGTNDSGALGRDTTTNATEQLKDMKDADADDDEDGDLNDLESTPTVVTGLPETDVKIIQIAATDNMSCILYENGDIYCWGTFRCNEGILGLYKDEIQTQLTPWKLPLNFVSKNTKIVQLAPGKDHILFLDEFGVVYAWGNSQQGQLGRKVLERSRLRTLEPRPFGLDNIKYISSGENHSFALDHNGDLFAWGLNQFGQCGVSKDVEDGALVTVPTKVLLPENLDSKVKMVAAGEHHSLVLLENGDLYCFGRVDMYEIGLEKSKIPEANCYKDARGNIRSVPVPTKMEGAKPFKYIACGSHHSLASTTDGVAFSWGFGETYAVGLGPAGEDIEVPERIKNTATKEHDIVFVSAGGQFSCSGGLKLSEEEADKREDAYDDE